MPSREVALLLKTFEHIDFDLTPHQREVLNMLVELYESCRELWDDAGIPFKQEQPNGKTEVIYAVGRDVFDNMAQLLVEIYALTATSSSTPNTTHKSSPE